MIKIENIEFKKDHLHIIDNKFIGWRYLGLCEDTDDLKFKILKVLKHGKFLYNLNIYIYI